MPIRKDRCNPRADFFTASSLEICRDCPVFAVDLDKLPDAKNDTASAALVGFDLNFHTLAKATLTGLYGR
jgi:hypothetical protein